MSNGYIDVWADDVTIDRSYVDASVTYYPIRLERGFKNLTVRDSTVVGHMADGAVVNAGPGSLIERDDLSGSADGVHAPGDGAVIRDNWIHDLAVSATTHNDGIQLLGGESNLTIQHNRIDGPWRSQTSAVLIKPDFGNITGITVDGNWLSGGCYTLYDYDVPANGYTTTGLTVTSNTFAAGGALYNYFVQHSAAPVTSSGNRLSDGTAVPGLN